MEEDEFGALYADLVPETGGNHGTSTVGFEELDSDEEYEEILFGKTSNSPSEPAVLPLKSLHNLSLDREESEEDEELSLFGHGDEKGLGVPSGSNKFMQRPETVGSVWPLKEAHYESKAITGEPIEAAPVEIAELQKCNRLAENGVASFQAIAEDVTAGAAAVESLREDSQSSLPKNSVVTKLVSQKQETRPDLDDFTRRMAAIPGLATSPIVRRFQVEVDEDEMGEELERKESGRGRLAVQDVLTGGGAADWDSDSEDDLQILLNEDHSMYQTFEKVADKNFEGSEDEDEEDLVIVAGGESLEGQDWGEEQSQAPDGIQPVSGDKSLPVGDRQVGTADDRGLPGKTGPSTGMNQGFSRMGYGGHMYHHHSQYKVRPVP